MQAVIAVVAGAWVVLAVGGPAAFQGDPSVALALGWLRGDRFAALGEPVWPTVSIVPAFPVAAPPCVSLGLAR